MNNVRIDIDQRLGTPRRTFREWLVLAKAMVESEVDDGEAAGDDDGGRPAAGLATAAVSNPFA